MTPKDYKRRIVRLENYRDSIKKRIADLIAERTYIKGVAYDGVKVQAPLSQSNFDLVLTERIRDLEEELRQTVIELDEVKRRFADTITKISNPEQQKSVAAKWLYGMNLKDYAEKNHYAYGYIKNLYQSGYNDFIRIDDSNGLED